MNDHAGWFWNNGKCLCVYCGSEDSSKPCNPEHKENCKWYIDWHDCSCGAFDIPVTGSCHLVIPGTVITCGEMEQYCSEECMRKANEANR
jgi:hypothetical protein